MIRDITADDIPFVVTSLQALHAESPVGKHFCSSPEYVTNNLQTMIQSPDFFGIVCGDQDGFLLGSVSRLWYCPKLRAFEMSFYIRPERRGGSNAIRMVRRLVEIAADKGACEIHAGSNTDLKADKLIRLYERLGFERDGSGVVLRINDIGS